MVFSTTNLFKSIVCPKLRERGECRLTNCIYGHSADQSQAPPASTAPPLTNGMQSADEAIEPPLKRRKVTYNSLEEKPPSRADLIRSKLAAHKEKPPASSSPNSARVSQSDGLGGSPAPPRSLARPVTPPPTRRQVTSISSPQDTAISAANKTGHNVAAPADVKPEKTESLNPRLVASDPVGHAKRQLFLKYLHAELVRLNLLVLESATLESKHKFKLTPQQLITMALDLEGRYVRESGAVYGNVIKQRIASYKKMSLEAWVTELTLTIAKEEPPPSKSLPKPIKIETGLPLEQESLILPQLVADQKPLAAHGYIITPPSAAQIEEAKAAVAASHNWEECDRCSARFQVFPNRNSEGLLTGNGPCKYHPRRKTFPQRTKADKDKTMVSQAPYYPCCDEAVGTPGCTSQAEHVFNTKSPARLASVLPFINTPENPSSAKTPHGHEVQAVTFDCEMGYTANGLELIRLTAVAWPTNEQLVDVLVRPLGAIIDLNSRFSGVFPESFTNAIPYEKWADHTPPPLEQNEEPRLPIVGSPAKARELLCSFLTPQTPLIGHAIDNDLNTVRLCHPTIIDTVLLFPHPRGLPMRFGLKMLTQRHLNRQIQMGGDRGHDSKEDAIATGDLVRVKVAQKWKDMRITGWKIANGKQLLPPPPSERELAASDENAKALAAKAAFGTSTSKKRRRTVSTDGADDGSETDDEVVPAEGLATS